VVARLVQTRPPWLEFAYRWTSTFADPIRLLTAPSGLVRYAADLRRYRGLEGAEPQRLLDTYPCVHDASATTPFDAHYFFQDAWAARAIASAAPEAHVDIGGHLPFVGMLAAVTPVVFVDLRPIHVQVPDLAVVAADGMQLPFPDRSVRSLSCLHVAEHIGLGRYGDELDPNGSQRMIDELVRVLAPGGTLLFSVPVGRARLCFNAHRVFDPVELVERFRPLHLDGFAFVDDQRGFHSVAAPSDAVGADYACGLYVFSRS
jgi:SAM-dependent methyltransferase